MDYTAWLATRYWGNPAGAWLTAAGIFVGGIVVLLLVRSVLAARLGHIAARTATGADDLVVDLVRRTRLYFIIAVALVAGTLALVLPLEWLRYRKVFIVIAVLLQLGVWGNGLINFFIDRHVRKTGGKVGATATTLGAIGYLGRALLWAVLLLVGLDNLGFDVTAIITGLGIGGIAIALAVQNILGDLLASLSIVLDKPFVVGDFIILEGGFMGSVEHVGLKSTRLRSLGGEEIVLGNTDLLKGRIRNYKSMRERRQVFTVGIAYDTPPAKAARAAELLREAVQAQPLARFDRAHFQKFGDSTLDFEVVYYVLDPDYAKFMDTQQAINLAVLESFNAAGIEFAFPTRTIYSRNAV